MPVTSRKNAPGEGPLMLYESPVVKRPIERHSSQETVPDAERGYTADRVWSDRSDELEKPRVDKHGNRLPTFHHHTNATPTELFYDLFFVANLASFTTSIEVNNSRALSNYVGFFAIMWFTWFQVTIFGVRFARDSALSRLAKAGQLGVMVGFTFISVNFDPNSASDATSDGSVNGRALSLILMSSRFILALQYTATFFSVRHYPGARLPFLLLVATSTIVAIIFLGISFSYSTSGPLPGHHYAYVAWYFVSFVEFITTIAISIKWRLASFKGTHLVERLSLLTLIVLGEGILGLGRAIQTVWPNTHYESGVSGVVVSTVLLIYGFFSLYFDMIPKGHFGSVREQIWAVLHFPLHLALVLFDEGTKQFTIWNPAVSQIEEFSQALVGVPIFGDLKALTPNTPIEIPASQNSTAFFHDQAEAFTSAYNEFIATGSAVRVDEQVNHTALNEYLEELKKGHELSPESVLVAVAGYWSTVNEAVLGTFQIQGDESQPPPPGRNEAAESIERSRAAFSLFDMVLVYFYAATGIALLLLLVLWQVSKQTKNTAFDYVRIAFGMATGVTIALLGLLDITASSYDDPGVSFVNGPWVLPLPAILIVVLTIIFHLPFGDNARR